MRKEKKVEFVLTVDEVRLILTKRRRRVRKLIRRTRRMNKITRIKKQLTQNASLIHQRIGGICLVLLGTISAYVSRNEPDPGELVFTSVVLAVLGLWFLLTKKNLETCK